MYLADADVVYLADLLYSAAFVNSADVDFVYSTDADFVY